MVPSIKDNGKFEGILADVAASLSHININYGNGILIGITSMNAIILLSIVADFFAYHSNIKANAKQRQIAFVKTPPSLNINANYASILIGSSFSVYEYILFLPSLLISAISNGNLIVKIINNIFTITISKQTYQLINHSQISNQII